jgi:hypothetical protein
MTDFESSSLKPLPFHRVPKFNNQDLAVIQGPETVQQYLDEPICDPFWGIVENTVNNYYLTRAREILSERARQYASE